MLKHLTLEDRITISTGLKEQRFIQQIEDKLGKSCCTISREIRNSIISAAHKRASA